MLNIERGNPDILEGIAQIYQKNSTDCGPGYVALDIAYAPDTDIKAHLRDVPDDISPEAKEQIEQAKNMFQNFDISHSYYDNKADIITKKGDIIFSGEFPLMFSEHILMGDAIRYMCSYTSQESSKDKGFEQIADEKELIFQFYDVISEMFHKKENNQEYLSETGKKLYRLSEENKVLTPYIDMMMKDLKKYPSQDVRLLEKHALLTQSLLEEDFERCNILKSEIKNIKKEQNRNI